MIEIFGVPYLKKGGEIKQVPKGQSGWIAYLNPKNWGAKDYVADNFSQAFNQAEADGEKEFLWRGNRYAVKRVDPKGFNEQLEWFKNYINNYKLQDVQLDFFDSIKVDKLIGKEQDRIFKQQDSLYNNFDWYNGDIEEYNKLSNFLLEEHDRLDNNNTYYENYRKQKLDSVLYKLNNLKQDRFILTTKSNFKDGTVGYYNPKVDSLYATEDPGTFVHELAHATGADRLKNLQPTLKAMKKDLKNTGDLEYVQYLSTPNEMGARYIQNLFLKHLNLPLNEHFVDKDLKKVE